MPPDDLLFRYLAQQDAQCPKCGYSLAGSTAHTCPECGLTLALTLRGPTERWGWWVVGLCAWLPVAGVFLLYVVPAMFRGAMFQATLIVPSAGTVLGLIAWFFCAKPIRRAPTRVRATLAILSFILAGALYGIAYFQ